MRNSNGFYDFRRSIDYLLDERKRREGFPASRAMAIFIDMHPRTSRLVGLLCVLALLFARALAAEGQPILVAPEGARQGDPVLVWALSPAGMTGSELLLVDSSSKTAERSRAFAAPAALLAAAIAATTPPATAAPPSIAPDLNAGGPAGPARPAPSSIQSLGLYGFLMAIPNDLKPGPYRLVLEGAGQNVSRPFVVAFRRFPFEKIPLDQANSDLLTQPDPRKTAEARSLEALVSEVDDRAVFIDDSDFLRPVVPLRRTAGFGDRREYLFAGGGSDFSVHGGEDLAVVTGTPVLACERGKVVLCADREVTGLSVVIEHLPGLYSLYFHLSKIDVAEGQLVERGERLGLSGSTGLSTGPHLHWELRAMGRAVDPECWVGSPLLDTKRFATTITPLFEGR
jgi:murein DD-endopeptidase MepM/ murein hydrolase activator NlpD